MRRFIRILALVIAVAAVALWLASGANRGWTATSVPVKTVDPVTSLEGIEYRPRFVPGLDFLGAGLLGAGIVGGVSLLVPKRPSN